LFRLSDTSPRAGRWRASSGKGRQNDGFEFIGLAPIIVADIFRIIGELRANDVAVLLVEQNAKAALEIADRAYVMELGEFILSGSAKEIAANQRVAASYLGFQHEGASGI
jgi:branched-chain amino acid transport system ATP-binding protein